MPLFGSKKSKIPPPQEASSPQPSSFGAGGPSPGQYGNRGAPGNYDQQPQQQQQGYQQGYSQQQGPPAGYGGARGPQQYGQQPPQGYQQSAMFRDARAPNSNLGSGYDSMMNNQYGGGNRAGSRSAAPTSGGPPSQDELEAEYGGGSRGGASSSRGGAGGDYDGQQEQTQELDEDDEVEAIKQQMRFTKQESLSSTRNALRIARETEETATGTVLKLGEQSDKIANTERLLDMSKAHSSRADDNAREIVALNRSIFRPNIQFDKKAKRDAEEARILNRHIEEREEREAVRAEALRAQNRADQALTGAGTGSGRFADRFGGGRFGPSSGTGKKPEDAQKNRMAQRSRYQFEATGSDDELEQELEDNLDEIGHLSGRLNQLGRAMGTEIDEQNTRINRISDKASKLDTRVYGSTQRLERIK